MDAGALAVGAPFFRVLCGRVGTTDVGTEGSPN